MINTEINKHNYKAYGIQSNREFRKFKKRLLLDLSNNPLTFSKYYKPVKSSIWNPINMSLQGAKSKNARYNHSL
tara:strand:+ start:355 stop:576 length:222 start_codon:yes stop_codon:yes gene_type:complete